MYCPLKSEEIKCPIAGINSEPFNNKKVLQKFKTVQFKIEGKKTKNLCHFTLSIFKYKSCVYFVVLYKCKVIFSNQDDLKQEGAEKNQH